MRKSGTIVAALATCVLVLFGAGQAQAATNGSHATTFTMSVGGTSFVSTVYYHNTGIGTSSPNHMVIDEFAWDTSPDARLDRITMYGDIHGDNTYPARLGIIDTPILNDDTQNDVPQGGDALANTAIGVGESSTFESTGRDFDNGTNLWFEVCVTGGVGNSGDHVCVKHASN